MKLILAVDLVPDSDQYATLVATMNRFNLACNDIAREAHARRCANKVALQKVLYYRIREEFGLSSQLTIRAIAKVVEAYKRDKSKLPIFRLDGGITYDDRILSWKGLERVSLLTLDGRVLVPVRFGAYQRARLDRRQGQADLVLRNSQFVLLVTLDVPEPPINDTADMLGVDFGIVNLALSAASLDPLTLSRLGTFEPGHSPRCQWSRLPASDKLPESFVALYPLMTRG